MFTVLRKYDRRYWTHEFRFATGRSAIYHLLRYLVHPPVLLPAYVPEGVFNPCRRLKCPMSFYRLKPDLTPDIDDIRRLVRKRSLVIIIHYFGYPTPLDEIRKVVSEADGDLFEDCAHTLYDDVSKAYYGDVALWSLNKFMPVVDGAILRTRDMNVYPSVMMRGFEDTATYAFYRQHLEINALLASGISPTIEAESAAAYDRYYEGIEQNDDYPTFGQTKQSRLIEQAFDVEGEERVRKTNAWRMKMVLPGIRSDALPQFAFPILTKSREHRQVVKKRLIELGVLPARLADRWNHVTDTSFKVELDFLDRHLLLPLGDPMDQELIGQIAGAVCG